MSVINNPAARLFLAIDSGSEAAVETLLASGVDPNATPSKSLPIPLHQAVLCGNAAITDLLITYGADVNAVCPVLGATPLFAAAALGHKSIARTLIADGAPLNTADPLGNTPLMVAAHGGHLPIARALIEAGCDIHAANPQGITVLDIDHGAIAHLARENFPEPLTQTLSLKAGLAGVRDSAERVQTQASILLRQPAPARAQTADTKPVRAYQPPALPSL